jgi:hypothetical protein
MMQNPVIVGTTKDTTGFDEITFIKLDKNTGNEIFSQTYNKESCNSRPNNIFVDGNNNIIINCTQKFEYLSNTLLLKYSAPVANVGLQVINSLKVYPNPSTGIFNIDFNCIQNSKTVSIFTISGKLIKELKTNEDELLINLEGYKKGLYLLKIDTEQGSIHSKVEMK